MKNTNAPLLRQNKQVFRKQYHITITNKKRKEQLNIPTDKQKHYSAKMKKQKNKITYKHTITKLQKNTKKHKYNNRYKNTDTDIYTKHTIT